MFLSPNEEHDSLRQSVIWLDNQPQQFDGFSQLFGPPLMVTISHHFTGVFFWKCGTSEIVPAIS
jgi:hypothetical protein